MPEAMQKQSLGEELFPQIQRILQFPTDQSIVGKVTVMLLEMDNIELLNLLENEAALWEKVDEAIKVLQVHDHATLNTIATTDILRTHNSTAADAAWALNVGFWLMIQNRFLLIRLTYAHESMSSSYHDVGKEEHDMKKLWENKTADAAWALNAV